VRKFRFFLTRYADAELAVSAGACFQPRRTIRCSCGGHPFERREPSHIVGKILQADLEARPDDPDGAHDAATRRGLLRPKHMLDARADAALRPVRRRFGLRQRVAARRAHMNVAAQASPLQRRLIRGRAIGTVSEHVLRGVVLVQKPIEPAAVMHRRVGHRIAPDKLVHPVHIHVVLVAEKALPVLLGPARIFQVGVPDWSRAGRPTKEPVTHFHFSAIR
jgi:hypothetical protein